MVVLLVQLFPYISEQFEFLLYDVPEPSYGNGHFPQKAEKLKNGQNRLKSQNFENLSPLYLYNYIGII